VAGICLVLILLPFRQLGAVAATATGIWFLVREPRGSPLCGAAAILLTITLGLFWSDALLLLLTQPLKALDAGLVGLLAGARIEDNIVYFLRGEQGYVLAEGCTSVQNASLALMLWMALARTFRPETRPRDILVALGVFGSVMAANLIRLALMAEDRQAFELLHSEAGFTVLNAIITALALAWVAFDVRDEILR
jgi:exosortase/archaeosortase family protein